MKKKGKSLFLSTLEAYYNQDKFAELMKGMAYRGNWREPVEYIAQRMKESLSIRDLMTSEKAHQVFWNVYLGLNMLYSVHCEKEMNQGFADLVLEPIAASNPGLKFSYIKPADYEKENGQSVIQTLHREAEAQLEQYSLDDKFQKTIGQTTLKKLILIFSGNCLVHHSEI